jgi:hypothetical protein
VRLSIDTLEANAMALPNSAAKAEFFPARTDISVPPGVVGPDSYSFEVNAFVVRRETVSLSSIR